MRRVICGLFWLLPLSAQGQQGMGVRKVADGVYAAMPPADQRFDESNAAIVILPDGVLVVDTQTPFGPGGRGTD